MLFAHAKTAQSRGQRSCDTWGLASPPTAPPIPIVLSTGLLFPVYFTYRSSLPLFSSSLCVCPCSYFLWKAYCQGQGNPWCESQLITDTRNTGRRQLCLDSLKSIPDVSFWHHQGEQEIGKHPVITRVLELFCVLNSTMTRTELVPRPWLGPGLSCIVILLWVKVLDVSGWVVWQQWRLTPVLDTRMVDVYIFISIEVITRFIYLLLLLIRSLTASLNAVIFPSLPPKCWD